MIELKDCNHLNRLDVKSFLKNIPSIKDVEDSILDNAIVLYEENNILGTISYEIFSNKGLIRYFVFKKMLEKNSIEAMFSYLKEKAKTKEIKALYSLVNNDVILELFKSLDFHLIDSKNVYMSEKRIEEAENTKIVEYLL